MGTPTRFTHGVTNVRKGQTFGSLIGPSPTKMFQMFVDFTGLDYTAAAWSVTETDAGSTQGLVAANAGGEYGLLALVQAGTGAAAVNSIQLTTAQVLISDLTKRWWLAGRLSRDNADEAMGISVQVANATPFTVVDGIHASVAAASTDATFGITKNSTSTTATAAAAYGTSALNTFITLGMAYNGRNLIECYVDDSKVAEISTLTNLPDDVALLLGVHSMNSTANARNVHADYVYFAVER